MQVGILTVSDTGFRGQRVDTSGVAIREAAEAAGNSVRRYAIVPDEGEAIAEHLRRWADEEGLDVIFTTGGTGLGPRDVTPEATLSVVERLVPGMAEAMRLEGLRRNPMAMLSRQVVGVRGRTLIVNLPGSERAVREGLACLLPVLPHAVEMLRGGGHPAPSAMARGPGEGGARAP